MWYIRYIYWYAPSVITDDGVEFKWGKYDYNVSHRSLELEYHKPSDSPGGVLESRGQLDRHSRLAMHNRSH